MIIGGYNLDLYCSYNNNTHNYNQFPESFIGDNFSVCRHKARRKGWIFKKDGTVVCPICAKEKKLGEINPDFK